MSKATKNKHVAREVLEEFVVPTGEQEIVRVVGSRGNNLHLVESVSVAAPGVSGGTDGTGSHPYLVSMPSKFRRRIWIKRGDFLIVEPIREGVKVRGEIVSILYPQQVQYIKGRGLWPGGGEDGVAGDVNKVAGDANNVAGGSNNAAGDAQDVNDAAGDDEDVAGDAEDVAGESADVGGDADNVTGDSADASGESGASSSDESESDSDQDELFENPNHLSRPYYSSNDDDSESDGDGDGEEEEEGVDAVVDSKQQHPAAGGDTNNNSSKSVPPPPPHASLVTAARVI